MRRLLIKTHINKCNCKFEIVLYFHNEKPMFHFGISRTVESAADIKGRTRSNTMREMQEVVFRCITRVFCSHSKIINALCRYDQAVMFRPRPAEARKHGLPCG